MLYNSRNIVATGDIARKLSGPTGGDGREVRGGKMKTVAAVMRLVVWVALLSTWGSLQAQDRRDSRQKPATQPGSGDGNPPPYSLSPGSPSKEYIYIGGKLVAIDDGPITGPSAPGSLRALSCFGRKVNLIWADNGSDETGFKVERKAGAGGTYSVIWDSQAPNVTHRLDAGADLPGGLDSSTTYYYRVKSYKGAGESFSGEANTTPGSPSFSEPLFQQVTEIKGVHVLELRQAVNSVRTCAELQPFNAWTNPDIPSQGVIIQAVHVQELRQKLTEALQALGVTAPAFTDDPPTAGVTWIKKTHFDELRDGVQ